ncbi:MAG: hypothetical protein PVI99_10110, partial [Anaerolineales bacterium]
VFAESVLAYLGGTAPTFSEDFEAIQPYMYEQPVYQDEQQDVAMHEVVVDGVLHLDSTDIVMSNDRWGFNFVDMRAENYALQFDFAILDNQSEEVINISKGPPDMGVGYPSQILYSPDGNNFEIREEAPDSSTTLLFADFIQYQDREATYTLLLIFYDSQFAAFLDGTFIGYLDGLQFSIDQEILFNVNASGTTVVNFDNIKFWNLDGVGISAQGEVPTVEEPSFDVERILAKIESEIQPTFEDDFSQADMVWGGTSEGLAIWSLVEGGELTITDHAEDVDWTSDHAVPGLTFPSNGLFNSENFLLEFDYSFESNHPGYEIGIKFRSTRDLESGYKFYSVPGGGWVLSQGNMMESGSYAEKSGSNHIRLLVVDQYLAVFLNDELKFDTDDLSSIGITNRIWFSGEQGAGAIFDNVKFWNLDGVNFE